MNKKKISGRSGSTSKKRAGSVRGNRAPEAKTRTSPAAAKAPPRGSSTTKAAPSKKRSEPESPRGPEIGKTPPRRTSSKRGHDRRARESVEASPTLNAPPKRKPTVPFAAPEALAEDDFPRDDFPALESDSADPIYPEHAEDVGMLGIGSRVFPPGMDFDPEFSHSEDWVVSPDEALADDPSVETRIREIEERLDGLLASVPHEDLDSPEEVTHDSVRPANANSAVAAAREVLESEYYRKNWGRGSLSEQSQDVDDFGMDRSYEEKLRPALEFLYKKYFRVEVEGIRHVPSEGRAVLVANHSGALPFDGVMLREAIRLRHPNRSDLRWLAEDYSFYLPFLGVTLNRLGAVRACPENAERLLGKEHLLAVFPEGAEGTKKLYKNRYNLQRFGRGGFVRLCLKTQSPIIPCAIVGAEETNPILYRFDNLSKLLGLDYLPITPTFPWLGPLGLIPAPTKWRIVFGEPISVAEYGPQASNDHVLVGRIAEQVRTNIGDLLSATLRRRKSVWL